MNTIPFSTEVLFQLCPLKYLFIKSHIAIAIFNNVIPYFPHIVQPDQALQKKTLPGNKVSEEQEQDLREAHQTAGGNLTRASGLASRERDPRACDRPTANRAVSQTGERSGERGRGGVLTARSAAEHGDRVEHHLVEKQCHRFVFQLVLQQVAVVQDIAPLTGNGHALRRKRTRAVRRGGGGGVWGGANPRLYAHRDPRADAFPLPPAGLSQSNGKLKSTNCCNVWPLAVLSWVT